MRRANGLLLAALGASAAVAVPASAQNDDDDGTRGRRIVDVAFGAGLNTAQPGNELNHHIIPQTIRVGVGDVVNFVVSGLHVVRVYADGVSLREVRDQIPDECEVNPVPPDVFPEQCQFGAEPPAPPVIPAFESLEVYYEGINPLAPPPDPAPPAFVQTSATLNRVEGVSFLEPGRYLVICAVLEHFNDAMFAWVEVRGRDGGDDDDDNGPGGGGQH